MGSHSALVQGVAGQKVVLPVPGLRIELNRQTVRDQTGIECAAKALVVSDLIVQHCPVMDEVVQMSERLFANVTVSI